MQSVFTLTPTCYLLTPTSIPRLAPASRAAVAGATVAAAGVAEVVERGVRALGLFFFFGFVRTALRGRGFGAAGVLGRLVRVRTRLVVRGLAHGCCDFGWTQTTQNCMPVGEEKGKGKKENEVGKTLFLPFSFFPFPQLKICTIRSRSSWMGLSLVMVSWKGV
jgi:hypothetical protein